MSKLVDRTGERYGRLTVIKRGDDYVSPSGRKTVQWECLCDCGNTCLISTNSLRTGATQSCGCWNDEQRKSSSTKHSTHGARKAENKDTESGILYSRWRGMRKRCLEETKDNYEDYGGRGITICEEWNDFANFEKWALENGFREDYTLDRIDNNGNYCPENCRWVNANTQQRNKRTNRLITYNGETHTLVEWSEITGINRSTLAGRIDKLNWSVERALTTPVLR